MRILVLGAGGIGGYFGARIHDAGGDVTFLVRPARAAQLREAGLQVLSPHGDIKINPKIVTRDELIERRRASADVLLAGMNAESVDTDGLLTMMRALNDLRLVLGTQLDVSEDSRPRIRAGDPDAARWFAYERLSRLLFFVIAALEPD